MNRIASAAIHLCAETNTKKIFFRFKHIPFFLVGVILSNAQTVSAQEQSKLYDLPLDQLVNVEVSSASRFKQKSSEAPSAVDVVTADDIRSFVWCSLASSIVFCQDLFNMNLAFTKPIYGFQPTLGIYNVLDQHYPVLGGSEHIQDTLAMDGRPVRFRLEYGF